MLNKINKKIIICSLIMLAALTFATIMIPTKASAYEEVWGGAGYPKWYGEYNNYNQNYYQIPIYVPPPTPVSTPTIYSNSVNPSTTNSAATTKTTSTKSTNTSKPADNSSNLAASVIWGSNSFMPSGLIQWIFFTILVLLVVILVRKIYGGNEKYNLIPMKFD